MKKRIGMCVFGVLICGISVGFFKRAAFGVDPFQTLMSGLDSCIPVSFGTLYVLANLVLLTFSLIADRHYVGLATVINLTLLGYVAQYSHEFLLKTFPDLSMAGRIICLLIGIVAMCLASAFYFTADLGVSTYDAVSLIITKTWKIGEFRYVRIISDFICVGLGTGLYFLSGGSFSGLTEVVGAGTIITAFFMGPLIDYFNVHVAQPFLYGKKG
ncbi:MAG: hypothetical protein MR936_02130 [Eubacterium sp.]|nr:hypothetical protein [Eubacterium sp.]